MQAQLCTHGMNPNSCPWCYKTKAAEPKKPIPVIASTPAIKQGHVIPIGEATMRATQQRPATVVKSQDGTTVDIKQPYSSTAPMGADAHSRDKVWQPTKHESLIDRQPRHPHADEGTATRLK